MTDLIDTTEMSLRTIYELEEEGVVPLRARIVERLGHSGPTVSETVARMERDGLLALAGDRRLELSVQGRQRAVRVMRKHRLAERLLVDVLGVPVLQTSRAPVAPERGVPVLADQMPFRRGCTVSLPFTQSHPVSAQRQRVSLRLRSHLGNRARAGAAHAEVARDENVSRYHVGQGARSIRPPTPWWPVEIERWPRWISLDEAVHRRKRELPTVISVPKQRRVLDVISGRSKQAVQQWLHQLPADVAANIKVVSIDPHDAYRRAIQAELPHPLIVCDPFHLVRSAGTAMDSVRRDRQRIARTSGRLAQGARQSGKQHNWQPDLYRSRHRLRKWRTEFLAYFDKPATNGYAEGITNKIKVIKRRAYGLPTFAGFRERILLCCG